MRVSQCQIAMIAEYGPKLPRLAIMIGDGAYFVETAIAGFTPVPLLRFLCFKIRKTDSVIQAHEVVFVPPLIFLGKEQIRREMQLFSGPALLWFGAMPPVNLISVFGAVFLVPDSNLFLVFFAVAGLSLELGVPISPVASALLGCSLSGVFGRHEECIVCTKKRLVYTGKESKQQL